MARLFLAELVNKNGVGQVKLWGLGEIGKVETFENDWKRLKTCVKRSKIFEKLGETIENIRQFRSSAAGALAGRSQETEARIWFDGLENFGFGEGGGPVRGLKEKVSNQRGR